MAPGIFYNIFFTGTNQRFIDIEINYLADNADIETTFKIAAWRPGRYELQHYARNIQNLKIEDTSGASLKFIKADRNSWKINHDPSAGLKIKYRYFAMQMDAGGSWVDDHQLYLNFIGCLLYPQNKENVGCEVKFYSNKEFQIFSALRNYNGILKATSFYELVDSPAIWTNNFVKIIYNVNGVNFNCLLIGNTTLNKDKIEEDFKKFTEIQYQIFGEFPFEEYYFLIQCVPYEHYHGVEHAQSTVIVLGPAEKLHEQHYYDELLGISSHELFHAWNACKIKPKELLPYDFSKEVYFDTGFVIEGFTTYYGDLILARCKYFSIERYFQEWNKVLKKHFHNYGNAHLSLADSSVDLWVDGYIGGIPDRKVSIYGKGAVVAWLIDFKIRKLTSNKKSLDDVMKILWENYGKKDKGYTSPDIYQIVHAVTGENTDLFLNECIYEQTELKELIENLVSDFGLKLTKKIPKEISQRKYGMHLNAHPNGFLIEQIAPNSPADKLLCRGDVIINVKNLNLTDFEKDLDQASFANLVIWRDYRQHILIIEPTDSDYFLWWEVELDKQATTEQIVALNQWLWT